MLFLEKGNIKNKKKKENSKPLWSISPAIPSYLVYENYSTEIGSALYFEH